MSESIQLTGSRLCGQVSVGGAKSCVPVILGLAILNGRPVRVMNPPGSSDLNETLRILEEVLGAGCTLSTRGDINISAQGYSADMATSVFSNTMSRASLPLLGILASCLGRVALPLPRGCNLGQRPIDLHHRVLAHFGLGISETSQHVSAVQMEAAQSSDLILPRRSVGASIQAVLLAAQRGSRGMQVKGLANATETRFLIAELEKVEVVRRVSSGPTLSIEVERPIQQGDIDCIRTPTDPIEIGSWVVAGLMIGEDVSVNYTAEEELERLLAWLWRKGAAVELKDGVVRSRIAGRPSRLGRVSTREGVHTDYVSILAALAVCSGESVEIEDVVFPARAASAVSLGADVARMPVIVPDIRLGFALLMLGLALNGRVNLDDPYHLLDRGYPNWMRVLQELGIVAD